MVPVSPRSGLRAESCEGPQPGEELPAGSQPGIATAANDRRSSEEDDLLVRSIVDRCLRKNESGAAGPSRELTGGNINEDVRSVSSVTAPSNLSNLNLKRSRKYQDDVTDSDIEDQPFRSHKVLRSRVIGSDSDEADEGPIVLSDFPENVEKVHKRRTRARNRAMDFDPPVNMDLSADLTNLVFSHCRLALEDVVDKDADSIAGLATGWLDMELVRTKSKNVNGRLSGCLKDRIVCMRSMIKILVDRFKDSGDITYLRR